MFVKCVNCDFNVIQNSLFCLNCGIENPSKPNLINEKHPSVVIIVLITIAGGILGLIIGFIFDDSKFVDLSFKELSPFAGIGALIGFAFSLFIESLIRHNILKKTKVQNEIRRKGQTLLSKEKEISDKKFEIIQDNLALRDLLEENPTISDEEKLFLEMKSEIIDAETFIYDMQLFEIDLLREKNRILPIQQNINQLNLIETENGLSLMEEILEDDDEDDETDDDSETNITEDELTDIKLADFRNRIEEIRQEAEKSVLKHSEDLYKAAEVLQKALTRRKDALLRGVTPTNELIIPFQDFSNLSLNETNFKIASILTNFFESFNKLAIEFEKLDEPID